MLIDIITLFPEMFGGVFGESIIKRAVEKNILAIRFTQLRDFAFDKHRQVDDSPDVLSKSDEKLSRKVIITDPSGEVFTQAKAKELATLDQIIFICGHYEGFDARIYDLADELISIGDYVLTGGELPAMVIVDAVARMLPNVLGSAESAETDSFFDGLLGYPQYTRPRNFEGKIVPEVLFSGHHANIKKWRGAQALNLTRTRRPDLIK